MHIVIIRDRKEKVTRNPKMTDWKGGPLEVTVSNLQSTMVLFLVPSQTLMLLLVFSSPFGSKLFGKAGEIFLMAS